MSESKLDVHNILIEKCRVLINTRHTKLSLYSAMGITPSELANFIAGVNPSDNLLQKVASHPLINLEVVKSYKLIEGKQ